MKGECRIEFEPTTAGSPSPGSRGGAARLSVKMEAGTILQNCEIRCARIERKGKEDVASTMLPK